MLLLIILYIIIMNKIILSGSFGRETNGAYVSNILINNNITYTIPSNVNTIQIVLNIKNVVINIKNTIDIDFYINNVKIRKSIINPQQTTVSMNYEFKCKPNDIIKIFGYVSGTSPTNPYYTIIDTSYIYCYTKTEYSKNLININNIYNQFYETDDNIKIINSMYNKTISNFRILFDNIIHIIGEKYILTFPMNYSSYIYSKIIKENMIDFEIIGNLSNKIINIIPFNKISINNYFMFINNALSQLLECGWWCKGNCNPYVFNYGQLISPYNYGSLQDATGLFIIKLIVLSLKENYDNTLYLYLKKMVDYLIAIQYNNGGIPQYYPLQGGYFNNICMNDGGTLNYLKILGYILDNVSQLLDTTTLEKLIICQQKAFNLIKQLQIKINGIPTIWAMQYDPITLLPTYARTFEPACLGSLESCQLLIYLKEINFTYNNIFDIELQQSYNYGVSWFSNNAITNIIQTTTYDNTNTPIILYTYNTDNIPCRLWARMININTLKPIYIDRQGIQYDDINLLDVERKLGYTWLGNWGEYLLYI